MKSALIITVIGIISLSSFMYHNKTNNQENEFDNEVYVESVPQGEVEEILLTDNKIYIPIGGCEVMQYDAYGDGAL